MKLGEAIKSRRKALRLTQSELGERIGLDASAISKIERGNTQNLKPQHLEKLEGTALGVLQPKTNRKIDIFLQKYRFFVRLYDLNKTAFRIFRT